MSRPQTIWETARLVARPATSADAEIIFDEYASDPAVAKFMTWRPHRDITETLEFLRRCERVWADGLAFASIPGIDESRGPITVKTCAAQWPPVYRVCGLLLVGD